MKINIQLNPKETGKVAANQAASLIRATLEKKTFCNIILATGNSQLEMLSILVKAKGIDWSRIRMFHLDEYLNINDVHPASFRKYLKERFVNMVSPLQSVFYIEGDAPNIKMEIERLNYLIQQYPIDVAMIGIGENGHLAFNDPPANFETDEPFIVVELDEACRRQQYNEGWFARLEAVPHKAISMSIRQIMKSKSIVCTVPDERKATAVKAALAQHITNDIPASILQEHPDVYLFLDTASSNFLKDQV